MMPERFAKNAAGDFYIVDGCCLTCGVMHDVAPSLIDWHEFEPNERGDVDSHCYVGRQPRTPVEISQMLEAMEVMDLDCLRYGGQDAELLARIKQLGLAQQCDVLAGEDGPAASSQKR